MTNYTLLFVAGELVSVFGPDELSQAKHYASKARDEYVKKDTVKLYGCTADKALSEVNARIRELGELAKAQNGTPSHYAVKSIATFKQSKMKLQDAIYGF